MKKITPIIDDDHNTVNFILSDEERSTTVTANNFDMDICFKILEDIFMNSESIELDDVLALNDENTIVKAVSASASGKDCITKAFKEAFSDGVTNTAAILITVSKNRSFAEVDDFLSSDNFSKDGFVIWKVLKNKKLEESIRLDAIIFT